ncbi:MAG: tetratricopeptide repeat protein [Terracidiphilus sp.]
MTPSESKERPRFSRRAFLKTLGSAPMVLRPAPFFGSSPLFGSPEPSTVNQISLPFADVRLSPHYPTLSPLAEVLRLVTPGSDEYITEKYAFEIESILKQWSRVLTNSPHDHRRLAEFLGDSIQASSFSVIKESKLRSSYGIDTRRRTFDGTLNEGRNRFLKNIDAWLGPLSRVTTAEFEIYGIEQVNSSPVTLRVDMRYDLVGEHIGQIIEERVGLWHIQVSQDDSQNWKALKWEIGEETLSTIGGPAFIDVTQQALGETDSYAKQMLRGADHWRTVLDGAIGVDVYANNGVAVGDFDNDGFDDIYVCQPAGLPNRIYRNRGDGTFEDATEKAGVGVLDGTASALFADFENRGLQDLLVVCGTGPLLFRNLGNGTFSLKRDAFKFAREPQGTFTHAALADYDRDGRLDIYLCTYMYYLGLDQYHYPIPYYDARNGPPNCLFHNDGNGNFTESTETTGLGVDNDRYSFACGWGDSNGNGLPDLFVANDFGSSQLYRNNGNGTFSVASDQAHVEAVGAGMGCAWADFDNDGHQDVYVPSMWEAAGQRVSGQKQFHQNAPEHIRGLYQRHARGNALYRNQGDGTFQNVGREAGVEMGRWSWSSDFLDFDHDGFADLYIANGYLSGVEREDLASFFWRQVVAKSSEDATPASAYEHGWNAINELVRSDHTWHGYARNVMFVNNQDGTFSEISGPAGLDFSEDSRSFALADIDHDGRLEIILKNRNAPQLRILHNSIQGIGDSISFRLKGVHSNRDAIGASIIVEAGSLRQTKYLQAGSGFLAQHSKCLFFGVGRPERPLRATIRWPNGLSQIFENLPPNHFIEVEEGLLSFTARPFESETAFVKPGLAPKVEPLPSQPETWLLQTVRAPGFSLPDLSGAIRDLTSFRGKLILLNFWAMTSPSSLESLKLLRTLHTLASDNLDILAVNLDSANDSAALRSFVVEQRLAFPVLFANEKVAGIYNIIYRYLFDRRRDLPIPVSFLLDKDGMILKVYQGTFAPASLLKDIRSIPKDADDRMQNALPFKGKLVRDSFQRNDFTYGVAMYQHGYFDQAAESFRQVLEVKPNEADAYYNLGTLSLKRDDFQQARTYLEKTVQLRPNYPEAWNNLGMIAAQHEQLDEAIRDFQESLKLRPGYGIALLNLGNVYRRQHSFEKAEDCFKRAIQIQPDDPEVSYSLGMLYAQQGRLDRAADYLQRALALRPAYPEALNNLGVLYVRGQQYAQAEDQFKTGIRLAPDFDQSYLNLARLYAIQNKSEKARQILDDLLRMQPNNSNAKQAIQMLQ